MSATYPSGLRKPIKEGSISIPKRFTYELENIVGLATGGNFMAANLFRILINVYIEIKKMPETG